MVDASAIHVRRVSSYIALNDPTSTPFSPFSPFRTRAVSGPVCCIRARVLYQDPCAVSGPVCCIRTQNPCRLDIWYPNAEDIAGFPISEFRYQKPDMDLPSSQLMFYQSGFRGGRVRAPPLNIAACAQHKQPSAPTYMRAPLFLLEHFTCRLIRVFVKDATPI